MDHEVREAIRDGDYDKAWRIRHRGARPLKLPISTIPGPGGMVMSLKGAYALMCGRFRLENASETDMSLREFAGIIHDAGMIVDLNFVDGNGRTTTIATIGRPNG